MRPIQFGYAIKIFLMLCIASNFIGYGLIATDKFDVRATKRGAPTAS